MDYAEMLNQLREDIREMVRQEVANAISYTQYSLSSKTGTGDKVMGHRLSGAEYDNEAQRIQHFGFRSRPTKDTPAVRISTGGGSSNSAIIAEDPVDRYGPQDLEDGETAIYSAQVERGMHLDEDGQNNINAKVGQKVILQGGGKGVARLDDTVAAATTMAAWITKVQAVAVNIDPTIVAPTDFGTINSASTKTETG